MIQPFNSSNMIRFNKNYLLLTVLLFLTELLIALYAHDDFIRPFVGDLLVVILIYCAIKSFFSLPVWNAAIAVFLFACLVEMLQYFHLVQRLGIQKNTLARIIIGTSFSWMDIVAYAIGTSIVLLAEHLPAGTKTASPPGA